MPTVLLTLEKFVRFSKSNASKVNCTLRSSPRDYLATDGLRRRHVAQGRRWIGRSARLVRGTLARRDRKGAAGVLWPGHDGAVQAAGKTSAGFGLDFESRAFQQRKPETH